MHKDEAALFWMMIQKELDQEVYPGLTEDFFREAFSAVLPPKEVVVQVSKPIPQTPTQRTKSFEDEVKEFSETFDQNVDEIINEVTEKRGPRSSSSTKGRSWWESLKNVAPVVLLSLQ